MRLEGGILPGYGNRMTVRAIKTINYAREEATLRRETLIGTEHLLLGLLREIDSRTAQVFKFLGLSLSETRTEIERQVFHGHACVSEAESLTPRSQRVLALADEEAKRLDSLFIDNEHLLLGLIREGDGLAARVLLKLGANIATARHYLYSLQEEERKRVQTKTITEMLDALPRRKWRKMSDPDGLPFKELPKEVRVWAQQLFAGQGVEMKLLEKAARVMLGPQGGGYVFYLPTTALLATTAPTLDKPRQNDTPKA